MQFIFLSEQTEYNKMLKKIKTGSMFLMSERLLLKKEIFTHFVDKI